MSRDRILYGSIPGGTRGQFTHEPDMSAGDPVTTQRRYCSDTPEISGDCGPLYVETIQRSGGVIDRPWFSYFGSWFNNYTCDWHRTPANGTEIGVTDTMDNYEAAAVCAARTNPSRPSVDATVAALELQEVSQIFRSLSGVSIRSVADLNLRYQFGIRPMVSDLMRVLTFQGEVDNRVKELRRLRSTGIRRTISLDDSRSVDTLNRVLQSAGAFINKDLQRITTEKVWGHARWRPDESLLITPEEDLRMLAFRAVTGLTVDISTAWNRIPWSWLADWCSNMGDVLMAHRNVVGATLEGIAIMRHTTVDTSCGSHTDGGLSMTSLRTVYEIKRRQMVPVIFAAHLPELNAQQLGIVASLAITRRRYR